MKNALGFIAGIGRLIRFPNLLIIILTQFLLRSAFIGPFLYKDTGIEPSSIWDFIILVLVTLLIASGGYIINDYFDVKIDRVNKPDKTVIDRQVTARGAIASHLVINGVATLLGFYLAYRIHSISFGLIFPFIAVLLWFYSASYKRSFLWGNLIVAFLSAFVILIVWLFEFFYLRLDAGAFASVIRELGSVTRVFLAYALFAFLVSLFREIIKDMEDWEGDERYGCRTLPLVIGMGRTRIIAILLMVVNIVLLGYGMLILYRLHFTWAFWYFLILVQLPVLYLIYKVYTAKGKPDYHYASTLTKVIMLTGILSMQIISLNF
jgi:4-hydroxybenzoate polyprenyltransferase